MAPEAGSLAHRLKARFAGSAADGAESQGLGMARASEAIPTSRIQTAAFFLILASFLVLATYYNLSNPLFESPDELEHAAYVAWLADVRRLPVLDPQQPGPLGQEAVQAPLYYVLVATSLGWLPHREAENLAVLNPQANIGEPLSPGNKNRVLHDPEQEGWPYRGTSLFIHLARGLSSTLAIGTLWAIYRLGRITFPGRAGMALAMMAFAAFIPQFLYLSSTASNDNLVILIASWTLVLLAQWLRRPRLPTWGQVGMMGVLLGLAVLAKLSGVLLWPLVAAVLVWLAWRSRDLGWLIKAGLLCFAITLAVCGWWLVRNQVLYGDLTASQALATALGGQRQALPTRLADILAEFRGFRYSLWGLFGWFNILSPAPFYWLVDAMTLVGILGFGLFLLRSLPQSARSTREIILMLFVWLCLVAVGVLRWAILISSQGRLAFPALAALVLFLVVGWAELVPRRLRPAIGVAGLLAWAAWAAICPSLIIRPAYARPALLDPGEVGSRISHETDMNFRDEVTLLGYRVQAETVMPGEELAVSACWRGNRAIEANYLVFVQLLVDNDLIAAQEDTYHGLGSFPTSFWPVGTVFCDEYHLRVSDTVPAPGPALIAIGLYLPSGERLPVWDAQGQPISDQVRFPGPPITFPEGGRALHYEWDRQIALVDYQLESTALAPGGTLNASMTWLVSRPVSSDYAASLQLLDEHGTKIGQSDVVLPASTWAVGESVADHRSITISEEAAVGVYQLKLVVYDPVTVENLTLYRDRQMVPSGGLLDLWTVRVLPADPARAIRTSISRIRNCYPPRYGCCILH